MDDNRLQDLTARAMELRGKRDMLTSRQKDLASKISNLELETLTLEKVNVLFRGLVDQEVLEGVKAVEALLTEGLRAVFDDQDIRVSAETKISRGKVSVSLTTSQTKDGQVIEGSSLDSFGGSVQTVQSVLLRVIIIARRGLAPFLCLDETLPAFDSNYVVNMAEFLSALCKRLGMDMLVVTHNPAFFEASDTSYRIVRKAGESVFEKVR